MKLFVISINQWILNLIFFVGDELFLGHCLGFKFFQSQIRRARRRLRVLSVFYAELHLGRVFLLALIHS